MLPLRLSNLLDLDLMREDAKGLLAEQYPEADVVEALARRVDDYITWDWVVELVDAPAGSPGAVASVFAASVLETLDGPVLELLIRRLVRRVRRTMDEGDNDTPRGRALASLRDRLKLGRMRTAAFSTRSRVGSRSSAGSRTSRSFGEQPPATASSEAGA